MAKKNFFKFISQADLGNVIIKNSIPAYASLALAMALFIFKGRYAIKTNQSIAPRTRVAFVSTPQPFAMISMNHTFRSVQPVVERFQGNASIAEVGGEVMARHSNEIVQFVAANTHLNHVNVNRRSNALSISQNDRVVRVAKTDATGFEFSAINDIQSFENKKWRGFTFDYAYDFQSDQQNRPVKANETHSYAFTSRYKIQRGDGTVNPFAPTKQLWRNTTLDFLGEKIEHAISNLLSNGSSDVSSEENLSVLQGAQSGLQGADPSGSGGGGLSEAGTGSEGSRFNVVQTGDTGEIQLEPQEVAALEKKIVLGLADMIVDAHNTSLLEKLQKSPKFEAAAKLVHQEVGEEINRRLNAGPFTSDNIERVFQEFPGLFRDSENNQISVYVEEPSILNKLSKYVRLLEIRDEISVPGYPVNFTGDEKDSNAAHFSTFGDMVVYNQKSGFREKVKENVKAISNQSVSFANALSLEDVLTKVPEEGQLNTLTRVVTNIINEPQFKEEFLSNFVGNQETSIDSTLYDDKQESDHFLRRYLRTALGQRLLHTDAKNDKSLSVELPPELHNLKEQFTNFREPGDFTYSNGLNAFFEHILTSINEGLASTTPAQRRYVSVEKYQAAYTQCCEAKIQEMADKYPDFTEREKLMIYHAQIARIADQQDLEKFQENHISTSTLKKSVLGPEIETNINLAVDLLRRNASQRGGFIKTLAEFSSPECAQVINSIQEQHQYSVNSNFIQIEAMTRPLSEQEKEALFNPPSLTTVLFENCYNAESGKVESLSPEEIDQVLYAESRKMGFTNIGSGLPSPGPVLNYQVQETRVNKGDVVGAEKDLEDNTNLLTKLLEDPALIGDSRKPVFEFASKNAQELHAFLIEHDIPKTLADKVVIDGGIDNIESLQVAINDGSLTEIDGIGRGKAAKVKAVIHMHPQSAANVSSTPDIDSGPSNTVTVARRKPSVRRVEASRSTSDLVSLQKPKSTLSRSSSMPCGSNFLESSNQVKFLEEGPSSG